MDRKIRILLIDDHTLFREGLGRLLESENALTLVGSCGSLAEGIRVLRQESVDVVLLDYDLGDGQGASFPKKAAGEGFKGRILVVTAGMSDLDVIRILEDGIAGIFFKSNTPTQLVDAIHKVALGESWLDPKVMKAVIAAATSKTKQPPVEILGPRERSVLKCILEGLANKEIASELHISESTVKAVIQQLFEKAGVRTRGQLVRIALERRGQGWI